MASRVDRIQQSSPAKSFDTAENLFSKDQIKPALAEAQNAIGQDTQGILAAQFHHAGMRFQDAKEYGKAIVQYTLIQNNYPHYPEIRDVLLRLADSYLSIGNPEQAKVVLQQLLKQSPHDSAARQKISDVEKTIRTREELRALGYTQ